MNDKKALQNRIPRHVSPGCSSNWILFTNQNSRNAPFKAATNPPINIINLFFPGNLLLFIMVIQLLSHVWLCDPMYYSPPGFLVLHYLKEFPEIHVHWIGIFCHPLLLLSPIFPNIRVFSNKSTHHIKWSKYWDFSSSNSPSNKYSGLISFRIDGFDLLAVQGTLKSLLQYRNSKASILQCSAFFMVQL